MTDQANRQATSRWLTSYSFARAGVAAAWVVAAFTVGKNVPSVAALLLVAYPAWDAAANFADAQASGGLRINRSQAFNVAVSFITAVAVVVALGRGMNAVFAVFGAWAILSGVLQLVTGVRRRKSGGQWAMMLSGAQSALAGAFFVKTATDAATPGITDLAPYAAFGAFYFFVAAVALVVKRARAK